MSDNYYDSIAKGYNELHGEEQLKKLEIIKKKIEIKSSDKVLDVGCGTGLSSILGGVITGIDPSAELLKQAKCKTVCASAEEIPFKDNSFDIVVSVTAIQNFTDIKKGLEEIKRVGKDKFALSFLKKSEKREKILVLLNNVFGQGEVFEEDKDLIFIKNYK